MPRARCLLPLSLLILVGACSGDRRYPIEGQVLAIDPARQEITLKHGDIKGFMPGMTMPFKVTDQASIGATSPGDLIRATLVVSDSTGRLDNVVRVGHAPLPPDAPRGPALPMLQPGGTAPDALLIDQDGRARHVSEWRGKTVAVTFVYTRCPLPDFCPLMDRNFAAVQRVVKSDAALAARVHLLSVSFDPDHDTPAVLLEHARRAGADPRIWTWLTGERRTVETFALAFGVSTMRDDAPARDIVHNLRTAIIGPTGTITSILTGNDWTPEALLAHLRDADGT
ncbi:MAG: SCO family protein [Vicinamibacterales bacterium]